MDAAEILVGICTSSLFHTVTTQHGHILVVSPVCQEALFLVQRSKQVLPQFLQVDTHSSNIKIFNFSLLFSSRSLALIPIWWKCFLLAHVVTDLPFTSYSMIKCSGELTIPSSSPSGDGFEIAHTGNIFHRNQTPWGFSLFGIAQVFIDIIHTLKPSNLMPTRGFFRILAPGHIFSELTSMCKA